MAEFAGFITRQNSGWSSFRSGQSTLKRTFASLKSLGVLRREQLNKSKRDMTNFYTINYESELLEEVKVNESIRSNSHFSIGSK
ncbi:hypothetical protein ACLK2D_12365 [Escherichia coli]